MKRFFCFLLCICAAFMLLSCKAQEKNITFTGTIEAVSGASLRIAADDGAGFDLCELSIRDVAIRFDPVAGQRVQATILPEIRETYPCQVTAVELLLLPGGETAETAPAPGGAWTVADGVTLRLLQAAYPAGVQEMTLVLENRSDEVLCYGQGWSFERWENGAWEPLDNREDAAFTAEAYTLYDHSRATFPVPTRSLAAPLSEGLYRVTGCTLRMAQNDENLGADGSHTDYPAYALVFRVAADAQAEPSSQESGTGANGLPDKEAWEWYPPYSATGLYEARGDTVWQLVQDDGDGSLVAVLYRENTPEQEALGENALLALDLFDRTTGETFSVFGRPMVRQDHVYASETGGFWMETSEGQYFADRQDGKWRVEAMQ